MASTGANDSRIRFSTPSLKYLILAGGGAVLSGVLYVVYKSWKRRDLDSKDEGFVDVAKVITIHISHHKHSLCQCQPVHALSDQTDAVTESE